jgi:WD40 repeat protein
MALCKETNGKIGTIRANLSNTAVSLAWTPDGNRFAIAFENGSVMIRDTENEKDLKMININPDVPERIWSVCFSATRYKGKDYALVVGTWSKNLYFFDVKFYYFIKY